MLLTKKYSLPASFHCFLMNLSNLWIIRSVIICAVSCICPLQRKQHDMKASVIFFRMKSPFCLYLLKVLIKTISRFETDKSFLFSILAFAVSKAKLPEGSPRGGQGAALLHDWHLTSYVPAINHGCFVLHRHMLNDRHFIKVKSWPQALL